MESNERHGTRPYITVKHAGITRVFNVDALAPGDWFATEQAATDALEYASELAGGQLDTFGVTRELAWDLVEAGTFWMDTDHCVNRACLNLTLVGDVEIVCHGVTAEQPIGSSPDWAEA